MRSDHLVTILLQLLSGRAAEAWTMELCILGTTLTVGQSNCSHGVWFSQPWALSSACFDGGTWAVYNEWCEEEPKIWTVYPNRRGCMHEALLKNVLGIVYLGDDEEGGVISTAKRRLFLGQYPQEATRAMRWELNDSAVDVLIWGNRPFSVYEGSTSGEGHKCLLKGRHSYTASYSYQLKSRTNVSLYLSQEHCEAGQTHKWDSYQLAPARSGAATVVISPTRGSDEFHCTPQNLKLDGKIRSKSYKRNIENINFMEFARSKDLLTPLNVDRVNEQTERLGRKLVAHVYLEEPLPEMNFVEWKFLLMAEEIFDRACPDQMVPRQFFEFILIFYRFILLESFDKFPPTVERDDETIKRIESGLRRCIAGATPFVFKDYNKCSTGSEALIAEYIHPNGTVEEVTVRLPDKVQINPQYFDILLEATWKLMIFVHYYCADHFKMYPHDLSTIQQRWQNLMAPDILVRWQCPGKSYQLLRLLLRSMDVPKTLRHIDHCVAASHMYSVYPGWVHRPTPVHEKISGGLIAESPYGLNPALYPINKAGEPNFSFYRSKLGAQFPKIQWDQRTYCLRDFVDPAKELGYSMDKCGARPVTS